MDKNEREKNFLYEWGTKNQSDYYFQKQDKEKDSYFVKREGDENSYIREYGFETLSELMGDLDIMWGNDEVLGQMKKVIGVAALKNKPSKVISGQTKADNWKSAEGKAEMKDKLPAFIYNF